MGSPSQTQILSLRISAIVRAGVLEKTWTKPTSLQPSRTKPRDSKAFSNSPENFS